MEEVFEYDLPNGICTLPDIQKEYTYEERIEGNNFTEIKNPVVDSEGFVRDKNEPNIGIGFYTREPVTIIESTDMKKIQTDFRTLETKFDAMTQMFMMVMNKMDEQNKKIDEQNKKMDEQTEEIKALNHIISEQNERLARQDEKLEGQTKEISRINRIVSKQNEDIYSLKNTVTGLNQIVDEQAKIIREKNVLIDEVKNDVKTLEKENRKLKNQIVKLEDINANSENVPPKHYFNSPLFNRKSNKNKNMYVIEGKPEDIKGKPWNPAQGFVDTFSILFTLTDRDEEEWLKEAVVFESNSSVKERIKNYHGNINGRGKPDTLDSLASGLIDRTPLILAAKHDNLYLVKALINKGANPNYLDRHNFTALDYAQQKQYKNVVDYLKKHNALNGVDVLAAIKNAPKPLKMKIS